MKILITGVAGFIGFHAVQKLIENFEVIGIDNLNNYYDPKLKKARLDKLIELGLKFENIDISNTNNVITYFKHNKPTHVLHLAAQAGVRYSIENPHTYASTNISGFLNILEGCRQNNVYHLVYASSSSVYGLNRQSPFSEEDYTDHPSSLYAASKKSNELMAHTYSYLYKLPTTGLRFFTVYGPWGRPDMALFKFTKAILEEKPIDVFNHGNHTRDFTYIDDIVEGIIKTLDGAATSNIKWNSDDPDPATSKVPWCIYNIGNNKPVKLMDYINALEKALGKKAIINFLPLQLGDVPDTFANVSNLAKEFDYKPSTEIIDGISNFVKWYKDYYKK